MSYLSQVIYDFSGGSEPHIIKNDEGPSSKLAKYEDLLAVSSNAESAIGQQITQNNADALRVQGLITDQGIAAVNGGSTTTQLAAEITKLQTIIANLIAGSPQ